MKMGEVLNITQIWKTFFFPIVSMIFIFLFLILLVGKSGIVKIYQKYKIIKVDDKYYHHKRIKIKKNFRNTDPHPVIFLPVSEIGQKTIIMIRKPAIIFTIVLVFAYAMYKLMMVCANLYPITYAYSGSNLLLYSTYKENIAEIWTYFPNYTLEALYEKINIMGAECSYAKYFDNSFCVMLGNIAKICSIFCVLNVFLQKPRARRYLKTLFLLIMCLGMIIFFYYIQFQEEANVLRQKVYYVQQQLVLEKPSVLWNWEKFQIAVENVDNELRYVKDKRFYGAFSLYIGKYTIEF